MKNKLLYSICLTLAFFQSEVGRTEPEKPLLFWSQSKEPIEGLTPPGVPPERVYYYTGYAGGLFTKGNTYVFPFVF